MESKGEFSELVSLARQGNAAALDALFRECRDYLLLIANHDMDERLRTTHAPSDLVQATLAQASNKFEQFRGECRQELLGWVRAILKNEMRGTARRQLQTEKRGASQQSLGSASSWFSTSGAHPIDPELTPASEVELEEDAQRLRASMLRLAESHRQVLLLRNWQRMSFAEIAVRMERSENAVKKLWARALVALESELNG